jgi:hypothetical protein
LLCVPFVVLAIWQQSLLVRQKGVVSQWQQAKRPVNIPIHKPKPPSDFLVKQLQLLVPVFGSGVRLLQLNWSGKILQIMAEALSPARFFRAWGHWRQRDSGSILQLSSYRWRDRLEVKVQAYAAVAR